MQDLKIDQLKEYCKDLGLSKYSTFNKEEVIFCINEFLNSSEDKWDILQHRTSIYNLQKIFKSGELKPRDDTFERYSNFLKTGDIDTNNFMYPTVYLHYMFSDLIYHGTKWNYDATCDIECICCIDTKIFEDLPFYICDSVAFGECHDHPEYRIENLSLLKEHINLNILKNRQQKINKKLDDKSYMYSHEILIDKIPIKYVKAILVHKTKYVKNLISEYKLNIKVEKFTNSSYNYKEIFEKIL